VERVSNHGVLPLKTGNKSGILAEKVKNGLACKRVSSCDELKPSRCFFSDKKRERKVRYFGNGKSKSKNESAEAGDGEYPHHTFMISAGANCVGIFESIMLGR